MHKKRTVHAVLAVHREIGKLFQHMAPRFLVPGLNHGQIISSKTSGDWDTQIYKLACASTRTVVGLWERLTTETLLTLSCQLPTITFTIIWTLFCCWRRVEMSDWGPCTKVKLAYLWCWALGVTAHQDGATCHPLTGLGTLTPTEPVGVPGAQDQVLWRQKNQRQYWTVTPLWSCSLQEFISSIRKSEESFSNLCGLWGKKIWFSSFSCTSVSHNLLSSCRNPRVRL